MTITRKIRPLGGSLLVTIPRQLADCLGIVAGTSVSIEIENNQLIMIPVTPIHQDQQDCT
jgi:antitoxin component of MazEF toxin-antitoxin module